ncbi:surface carbohydrate biosynthesis protein [Oceanobacillus profundus]|uniref:surface carbohydrate biosynthesis protein n=1 Tax=Oceanobacillus profundus TaxID=372463 RepID=UPI0036366DF9
MRYDKRWLYLPVEVKVREMDAKLLLAYYAVKEGYQVIIGEHKMVELASTVYPAGVFFSKGYPRGFRKRIITNAKNSGHTVVELDEEGLLLNNKTQYLRNRMVSDMLDLVTQEYCWGGFQKEVIVSANPRQEQKCYIVGNPRFDLLTPKFNILYKEEAEQIRNEYGEFVLINTRFPNYNSFNGMKNDTIESMYYKKLYYSFVEMTKAMCREFPNTNFVIRPHPGENFESYRNTFSSYHNVFVVHEGSIIKWLLAAEVVIHNGCTSSIEACLLEKPIISYIPTTASENDVLLPNQLGMMAVNTKEVHVLLEKILNMNYFFDNNSRKQISQDKNSLTPFYKWPDKRFSYESILQLLNNIQLPRVPKTFSPSKKTLSLKENRKVKYFFPSLFKEEIKHYFEKIDEIEDEKSRISIKRIGKNLFEIQGELI